MIVHPSNHSLLDRRTVERIFLGRIGHFTNEISAVPVLQDPGSAITREFNKQVLRKSSQQLRSLWAGQLFSGKLAAVERRSSDAAVLDYVAANPGAVGYVDAAVADARVKVAYRSDAPDAAVLTLAIDHFPPYTYLHSKHRATGFFVDIVNELSRLTGFRVQLYECPWVRCLQLVEEGVVDLAAGVLKTEERLGKFHFVEPPVDRLSNHYRFYTLRDADPVVELTELHGKLVGIQRGVKYFDEFESNRDIEKVATNDRVTLIKMLLAGRIDAFIYSGDTIELALQEWDPQQRISAAEFVFRDQSHGHLVLSKRSAPAERLALFNATLAQLEDQGFIIEAKKRHGLAQPELDSQDF